MKSLLLSFTLSFCLLLAAAQINEVLNNKSVVDLTTAGMSKKIIISKIESSSCKFTTDTKSLIALKKAGVEEDVINAMVEKMSAKRAATSTAAQAVPAAASTSTATKSTESKDAESYTTSASSSKAIALMKQEGSGIYYYQASEGKIYELEATVFSQAKNNNWATALSYGFAKSSKVMSVSGSEANVQFKNASPVFYFYFDPENKSLNAQAPTWFASVSSPNEFLLIKFENKKVKNSRAVTTASANAYEQAQGIDDKFKASFKFKRLEKGIYEIYFEKPLEAGEYGFMYAGATATNGGSSPRVYDFGIK
ncbi:hypothetical protein DC498_06085 [Terrimonas sp.]|uniref:hypothetical protein n=1 Tax=Terrimonas sp. TaxID=1914338 RepID=UPI000D511FB6|nr:hypothetical protein [Terrimonas sp.]PVD52936.1 hypothetical protein DC498_06085 [Terrimonas sp.]